MKNNYSFRFLFSVIALLITFSVSAQMPLDWAKIYNSPSDNSDQARSIGVDAAGNVYVTGSAFNVNGNLDAVTIKYSPAGQQLWLQSYDGSGQDNDEGEKMVVDNAGNSYVVGYTKGMSSGADILTIKYNTAGIQLWADTFNGAFNNYDEGNSVAVDPSGNVYVCGYETDTNYTYNFVTIKYNASGVRQWVKIYNGPGNFNDNAVDIALDAHNNVYVTGPSDTMYNNLPNANFVIIKYDNNGNLKWRKSYDSPWHAYEYAQCLTVDRNSNIIMGGYGGVTNEGNDYYALKYDSSGVFQWLHTYNYGPNTFEDVWDITTDTLNNVILTGQGITSTSLATNDYVTVKYDAAGNFQWAARYDGGGNKDDRALSVSTDDSLCIYVTGYSIPSGNQSDIATVKYDAAGNQKWVVRYDGISHKNDIGNAVLAKNGNVYVAGICANIANDDYITIKYSYSALGIEQSSLSSGGINAFPNPSDGQFNISIADNGVQLNKCEIVMMDETGRIVRQYFTSPSSLSNGNVNFLVSVPGIPAGVYFVRVISEGQLVGVTKISVLK